MAKESTQSVIRTQMKAIRAKCLDCCCDYEKEVENCPITDCPIYPYRFGKSPKGVIKVNRINL